MIRPNFLWISLASIVSISCGKNYFSSTPLLNGAQDQVDSEGQEESKNAKKSDASKGGDSASGDKSTDGSSAPAEDEPAQRPVPILGAAFLTVRCLQPAAIPPEGKAYVDCSLIDPFTWRRVDVRAFGVSSKLIFMTYRLPYTVGTITENVSNENDWRIELPAADLKNISFVAEYADPISKKARQVEFAFIRLTSSAAPRSASPGELVYAENFVSHVGTQAASGCGNRSGIVEVFGEFHSFKFTLTVSSPKLLVQVNTLCGVELKHVLNNKLALIYLIREGSGIVSSQKIDPTQSQSEIGQQGVSSSFEFKDLDPGSYLIGFRGDTPKGTTDDYLIADIHLISEGSSITSTP